MSVTGRGTEAAQLKDRAARIRSQAG